MYVKAPNSPTVRDSVKKVIKDATTTKEAKSAVNFRIADQPEEACEGCEYFTASKREGAEGTCSKVVGSIAPDYVCDLWEEAE